MITFINDSRDSKIGLNIYKKSSDSIGFILRWNTKTRKYGWCVRRPKIKGMPWTCAVYRSWKWIHPVSFLPLDGPNGKELTLTQGDK